MLDRQSRKLGIACVGLGGAVSTTAIAGLELIRQGIIGHEGLPLGNKVIPGIVDTSQIAFMGWDFDGSDLASALRTHKVLSPDQIEHASERLSQIKPCPALMDENFCRNVNGTNIIHANSRRAAANQIAADIAEFRQSEGLDDVVVMNLASTEKVTNLAHPALATIEAFEQALDSDDPILSPAMIYAYAAITSGCAYGNFTPSAAGEVPALLALADKCNVPVAGRDGKTGQTFMKTVIAPALKARALHVNGWYSTNILGNRDGEALADPASLASKLVTKGDVLQDMLGYEVKDHIVQIHYYPPRGDDKEAWDNIDVSGFLGHKMQIKVNFLCRDSILAAPLVIDIARCLHLALQRGETGPIEPLGVFFKAPMTRLGHPVHAFHEQIVAFDDWIANGAKGTEAAQ
ncbi:MAG: inositol-3-phosphate synthase [Candidatus Competibacteraceae bacterium]|nr:inositol-3-phosphate synthase [Candidatus Competibacteraceae bacterium]